MADAVYDNLLADLRGLLSACDSDRLARLLGLRSASAAQALRADASALGHLAHRLAEGFGANTLSDPLAVAETLNDARSMLGLEPADNGAQSEGDGHD